MEPNFSAYPFERLRKLTSRDAQLESTLAQWIAARSRGERLAKLVASERGKSDVKTAVVKAEVVAASAFDPFAARCEVRLPLPQCGNEHRIRPAIEYGHDGIAVF